MNIYLDDKRETPPGYFRTYTVEETIEAIKANEGNIKILSLDNDLGDDLREGREVMKWVEEQAFDGTLQPIPLLLVHSQNNVAQDEMDFARYNAWRFWTQMHGHSRVEWMEKEYT